MVVEIFMVAFISNLFEGAMVNLVGENRNIGVPFTGHVLILGYIYQFLGRD